MGAKDVEEGVFNIANKAIPNPLKLPVLFTFHQPSTMPQIYLELDDLLIRPVDHTDLVNYQHLTLDVYHLFSDHENLQFLPEKQVSSMADAEKWLGMTLMNMHCGRNQTHIISLKDTGELLGIVDIIPPTVSCEHYKLSSYPFFIEFYLKRAATGKALMTKLLPLLIGKLKQKGIAPIAAVVNRKNTAACKVLSRCGYLSRQYFDRQQDVYALTA